MGPGVTRIYRSLAPGSGDSQARHYSPSHLQARYSSRSLFFPYPPPTPLPAPPILTSADIGGKDLNRQGQRHSPNASDSGLSRKE